MKKEEKILLAGASFWRFGEGLFIMGVTQTIGAIYQAKILFIEGKSSA